MASKRFEVDMALNASGVAKGANDGEKALKNLEDALEDAGIGGAKDLDKVENSLKDVQRQSEKTERALEDMGTTGKAGTDKVRSGAQEIQSEFGANMGEAVSSFRGEIEDIGQIGQDTLGGLAGTVAQMGPAGVVAGAGLGVAAAAVGMVTESFTRAKEATDEAKESAYEYGLTVGAAGEYADAANRINELTGSVEGLKKIQDLAISSGWEQIDVLKALATGDGLPQLTEAFDANANANGLATNRNLELQGVLDGTKQGLDLAKGATTLNSAALYDLATKAGKATGEVDDLGNKIIAMPDGKEIVVNARTGQAYEDLDAIERRQLSQKRVRVVYDVDDRNILNWVPPIKRSTVAYTQRQMLP